MLLTDISGTKWHLLLISRSTSVQVAAAARRTAQLRPASKRDTKVQWPGHYYARYRRRRGPPPAPDKPDGTPTDRTRAHSHCALIKMRNSASTTRPVCTHFNSNPDVPCRSNRRPLHPGCPNLAVWTSDWLGKVGASLTAVAVASFKPGFHSNAIACVACVA